MGTEVIILANPYTYNFLKFGKRLPTFFFTPIPKLSADDISVKLKISSEEFADCNSSRWAFPKKPFSVHVFNPIKPYMGLEICGFIWKLAHLSCSVFCIHMLTY